MQADSDLKLVRFTLLLVFVVLGLALFAQFIRRTEMA